MIKEADFFLEESRALFGVISEGDLPPDEPTLFKEWTTDNILRHLHFWNGAAKLSLEDSDGFQTLLADALPVIAAKGMRAYEDARLAEFSGEDLCQAWLTEAEETAAKFRSADPDRRLPWAGPPMSARSSISARLMETWAHGQAIYDAAGRVREDTDRIYPIAELGVRTFGWTYQVRGEDKPGTKPHVRLTSPSGDIWAFNDKRDDERIEGLATDFCQVVTQTRNIADVGLEVMGDVATDWMGKAQCFAGIAHDPPAPGARRIKAREKTT